MKLFSSTQKKFYRLCFNKRNFINDKFVVDTNIAMQNLIDSEGNGFIHIDDQTNNISFSSKFVNGKVQNYASTNLTLSPSRSLCQRKRNETFRDCFNRETEEFCDNFTSTAAYITNPSIALLIAALCSCNE